jgi:hypothetical protein
VQVAHIEEHAPAASWNPKRPEFAAPDEAPKLGFPDLEKGFGLLRRGHARWQGKPTL